MISMAPYYGQTMISLVGKPGLSHNYSEMVGELLLLTIRIPYDETTPHAGSQFKFFMKTSFQFLLEYSELFKKMVYSVLVISAPTKTWRHVFANKESAYNYSQYLVAELSYWFVFRRRFSIK